MRNFFLWLFETKEEPFDIQLFGFWHIFYALVIIATTIALGFYLAKKNDKKLNNKVLRLLAAAGVIIYVADFFIQPLFRDGQMNVDKLPFHICTLMAPVSCFVQFNERFERFREPVAFMSIVGPLMYICYPGSAIGSESPFCYEIIQTFVYHGIIFSWGFNNLATSTVKPSIKRSWHALVGICLVALWAGFGNVVYADYDWFFLTGSTFPFVPKLLMPVVVIAAVFGMVMIIYGLYYAWMKILDKRNIKKAIANVINGEKKENAKA